jgi:hypothetical protein
MSDHEQLNEPDQEAWPQKARRSIKESTARGTNSRGKTRLTKASRPGLDNPRRLKQVRRAASVNGADPRKTASAG